MRAARVMLIALFAILPASAAEVFEDLPIPADEFIYCTVCHGVQLMGNPIIRAPRLSGMERWYVERQMLAFKNGTRGHDPSGMKMRTMAAPLSKQQISEVASFVNATRSELPARTITGNVEAGRTRYATCYACHGESGQGNEAIGGPALAGKNDWYLAAQLRNYRDGTRGTDPDDTYGFLMRAATLVFLGNDESINDVVSYIATLQNKGDSSL